MITRVIGYGLVNPIRKGMGSCTTDNQILLTRQFHDMTSQGLNFAFRFLYVFADIGSDLYH